MFPCVPFPTLPPMFPDGSRADGSNLPPPGVLCRSGSGWSNSDIERMGVLASARHRWVRCCEPESNKTGAKVFSLIKWQRQKRPTGKIWWENKQSYKLYFFLLLLFLSCCWQIYQLEFCCFGNVRGILYATNHHAFRCLTLAWKYSIQCIPKINGLSSMFLITSSLSLCSVLKTKQ